MLSRAIRKVLGPDVAWVMDGEDLARLRIITSGVRPPTQAQIDSAIAELKAEDEARAAEQAKTDSELLNSAISKMSYQELVTWIDNQVQLPSSAGADAAIDALKIDTETKAILKSIAHACIAEATLIKQVARVLVASLKKAGYIS